MHQPPPAPPTRRVTGSSCPTPRPSAPRGGPSQSARREPGRPPPRGRAPNREQPCPSRLVNGRRPQSGARLERPGRPRPWPPSGFPWRRFLPEAVLRVGRDFREGRARKRGPCARRLAFPGARRALEVGLPQVCWAPLGRVGPGALVLLCGRGGWGWIRGSRGVGDSTGFIPGAISVNARFRGLLLPSAGEARQEEGLGQQALQQQGLGSPVG